MNTESKRCPRCKETKSLTLFGSDNSKVTKKTTYCKPCSSLNQREQRLRNPARSKLLSKYSSIRWRYKLTNEAYDLLASKGCQGCGGSDRLHVDHDHDCCPTTPTCGKCTRGMLCHGCNLALGGVREDPEILKNLILYLERLNGT